MIEKREQRHAVCSIQYFAMSELYHLVLYLRLGVWFSKLKKLFIVVPTFYKMGRNLVLGRKMGMNFGSFFTTQNQQAQKIIRELSDISI